MKVIGPLLMEILHFEDLWDTKMLSMNVVWVHVNLVELRLVISWEHNFFHFFLTPWKTPLFTRHPPPPHIIHVNVCIKILKTTTTLYIKLLSTSLGLPTTSSIYYAIWVIQVIWLKSSTSNLANNVMCTTGLLIRVMF